MTVDQEIAVTGLGLVTPAGVGAEQNWARLCEGESLAAADDELAGLPVDFSCRVPDFDAEALLGRRLARRLDRPAHLAIAGSRQAVRDAGLDSSEWDGRRVGVLLGVGGNSLQTYPREFALYGDGEARKVSPLALPRSVPNMVAAEVAMDLGARGPNMTAATACASGTTAIGLARMLLASGACDIVITGGADCGRIPMSAVCFGQMRALSRQTANPGGASRPFDVDRDGFVLGEGAGILVLERAADARARGARPRAIVAGSGASADAHHPVAPRPDGEGAAAAVNAALDDAGLCPGDIDHVNAHGTSTPLNDEVEARVIRRLFPHHPVVTANKSIVGHAISAAGGIEAAYSVLSLEHQAVPPTANLNLQDSNFLLDVVTKEPRLTRLRAIVSQSFGFGGQNAVVVLRQP